jgi:Fe-S oxidoreductase
MPAMDGGDMATAMAWADDNLGSLARAVDEERDIVVPGPTCSYVLKHDYPAICADRALAERVARRTFDACEWLMKRAGDGALDRGFTWSPGRVAYHQPCHLKVQNIGFKSRDLLQLLPDARVTLVERCTGMDGTWGMKKQFFDLSLQVAAPLVRDIGEAAPDLVVSDCPLAAIQIEHGSGHAPLHPLQVLDRAYHGGRPPEE